MNRLCLGFWLLSVQSVCFIFLFFFRACPGGWRGGWAPTFSLIRLADRESARFTKQQSKGRAAEVALEIAYRKSCNRLSGRTICIELIRSRRLLARRWLPLGFPSVGLTCFWIYDLPCCGLM